MGNVIRLIEIQWVPMMGSELSSTQFLLWQKDSARTRYFHDIIRMRKRIYHFTFFLELNRAEMIFFDWEGGRNFVDCFSMFDVEMNLPLIDLLTQRSYVHFTANTNWRQKFHKLNANSQDCTIFSLIRLKGKYTSDMIWH